MNRLILVSAVLVALIAPPARAAGAAGNRVACDTTSSNAAKSESTLGSVFRIAAAHVDWGGGAGPGSDSTAKHGEIQFVIGHCRWPDWAVAVAGSGQFLSRTSFTAPGSNPPFHPRPDLGTVGFEIQRRWSQGSLVHPVASVGLGSVHSAYRWSERVAGEWKPRTAHESTTSYVAVRGGGELNMFSHLRAELLFSQRWTGSLKTLEVDPKRGQGFLVTFLLEAGKFR